VLYFTASHSKSQRLYVPTARMKPFLQRRQPALLCYVY